MNIHTSTEVEAWYITSGHASFRHQLLLHHAPEDLLALGMVWVVEQDQERQALLCQLLGGGVPGCRGVHTTGTAKTYLAVFESDFSH